MRQIWVFLAVTFFWSWGFWWPQVYVVAGGELPYGLTSFFADGSSPAAWGPLVGALVSVLATDGWGAVRTLLRRGVQMRFPLRDYAFVIAVFPVLIGGAVLLALLAGEAIPPIVALAEPAALPIAFFFILLLGGPVQEEFGWRGVLLPTLLDRLGPIASSIAVGLVWGIWHLPLFFLPSQAFYYERPIWGLMLSTVLISFLFTWVYQRTNGSIWAVLLLHTMFNFTHYVFPALQNDLAASILWGTQLVAVGFVIWDWQRTTAKTRPGATPGS